MTFIICNQHTGLLLFIKQATLIPFAMHGIVGKVCKQSRTIVTDHVVLEMGPYSNG